MKLKNYYRRPYGGAIRAKLLGGGPEDIGKVHTFKRLTEDWSILEVENEIVSMFHHCQNGTKGLVRMYHEFLRDRLPDVRYAECDLCDAEVPEEIKFMLKLHRTRYK